MAEGSPIVYQVRLPLCTKTLTVVTRAIRTYRTRVRSRWRKLPDGTAAVIVLAALRHNQRPADLAAGYGISANTVRRWITQVIAVLAAQAPRLARVLQTVAVTAARTGHPPAVLLDGSLIPIQRPGDRHQRRRYYSGKHKTFGLLVLAITDLAGNLLWLSATHPGRTADIITAARRHRIPAHLRTAGLAAICDLGYTPPGRPTRPTRRTRPTTPPRPPRPPRRPTHHHHRPPPRPPLPVDPPPNSGQPTHRPGTRLQRTRHRRPEELAHPGPATQPPTRQRHHPATRPDDPHPNPDHPLTTDTTRHGK
jgi:hypothetical protein